MRDEAKVLRERVMEVGNKNFGVNSYALGAIGHTYINANIQGQEKRTRKTMRS